MSLEQAILDLSEDVTALTAVMEKMIHNQERLLAGQQAAIEKVAAGNPDKPTRGRPKKNAEPEPAAETPATDTQPTSEKPADTESGEADVKTASDKPAENAVPPFKDVAKKWMDKAEKGTDEYKKRGVAVMGILGHFGAGKMSELPEDAEDKAMFFLKRHVKGLPVNYDAPYDFAGDPLQDEPEVSGGEAAAEDDDDLFG